MPHYGQFVYCDSSKLLGCGVCGGSIIFVMCVQFSYFCQLDVKQFLLRRGWPKRQVVIHLFIAFVRESVFSLQYFFHRILGTKIFGKGFRFLSQRAFLKEFDLW